MSQSPARLQLHPRSTLIEFDADHAVTLPVGPLGLAQDVFRHDPPTPAELEHAIDLMEDALTASHLANAARGEIVTSDALLASLPGLGAAGLRLPRDDVEALFQRLASRSLGTPINDHELPPGRELAAALLILRECMHHLGFDRVRAIP